MPGEKTEKATKTTLHAHGTHASHKPTRNIV